MHPAAENWSEAEVRSVAALQSAMQQHVAVEGGVAWRGMPQSAWQIRSTFDHQVMDIHAPSGGYGELLRLERALLDDFCDEALREAESDGDRCILMQRGGEAVWVAMAFARHYGLPTRLVDWSVDPRVAAYFACVDLTLQDGAIWWFHNRAFERAVSDQWETWGVPTAATLLGLADEPPEVLEAATLNQRVLSSRAFEVDAPAFITKVHYPSPFHRMKIQSGFMTASGRLGVPHDAAIDGLPGASTVPRGRIVVPARLKLEVMEWLRSEGIHAASLGLPGFDLIAARTVRRLKEISRP